MDWSVYFHHPPNVAGMKFFGVVVLWELFSGVGLAVEKHCNASLGSPALGESRANPAASGTRRVPRTHSTRREARLGAAVTTSSVLRDIAGT